MKQHKTKIIISGGGTGGHIFPAIAIANALKGLVENIDILFIGAKGKMEMEKVPAAGYPIVGLWISGLQRRLTTKNLLFPIKLIASLIKAHKIINNFKPDVVIGVGGYASGPTLRVACKKRIPSLIQEQNSFPGITNKLLARKVNKVCVAFNDMERFFPKDKICITGNPVRQDFLNIDNKKQDGQEYFGLNGHKKTVLIIGGSQGAMSINRSIAANIPLFIKNDIQLIWQTGKFFIEEAKEIVKKTDSNNIHVHEFITKMDLAYSVADIVISRAGAIAISEICVVQKPPILVPLPSAAEDHQTKNAMLLANNNAGILIKNHETNEKLGSEALNLINDTKKQEVFTTNLKKMAFTDAADNIAKEIIKLINKK